MRTKTQNNTSLWGKTLALVAILALLLVVLMSGVDPVVAGGAAATTLWINAVLVALLVVIVSHALKLMPMLRQQMTEAFCYGSSST